MDKNGDGYPFAKIRLRSLRPPSIGDKFSSRSAQKGTIGNIIPEEDMPYTADGLRPDIIINPHAIPSRMTIGQLKESLIGKILVELGLFGDGTSYGDFTVKEISSLLLKNGYEAYGNELMYNGATGEQIECSVFTGPTFYQRLKHMVIDKEHSRANGPMVKLTRQPAEGRSREGGLRFGEMERDCVGAHGAMAFMRDRMYYSSDKYEVYVCNKCGMYAAYHEGRIQVQKPYKHYIDVNVHNCRMCGNRSDFTNVQMPYANKLLFQELMTMNVCPRIITAGSN